MMERVAKIVLWVLGTVWGIIFLIFFVRIFICDQFVVPSSSMEPTLISGDRILVNKLLFGARIYKNFDFNEYIPMESWRMPAIRPIEVNDIVVFNAPHGYDKRKIEFKINYVYAKRCVARPGDTIEIRNSRFYNNNYDEVIGDITRQQMLAEMDDTQMSKGVLRAYPGDDAMFGWTIKNMGPLYVPKAGDNIVLDERNYKLYPMAIEYETRQEIAFENGQTHIAGQPVDNYTFKSNYYYFCGDNVPDSKDSRYLGFVPEEFIVGVVQRISYSKDTHTNRLNIDRFWKNLTK